MFTYEQPYIDTLKVMEALQDYSSPKSKVTRLLQNEELLRIRRGLYVPGGLSYSVRTLANMTYGPSYISFEYALSLYGVIPERVKNITSAAFRKNKKRRFDTPVGTYLYRQIPESVFYLEVRRFNENNSPYLIATEEKAICDTLYQYRQVQSLKSLRELLFADLRIDRAVLRNMDIRIIASLAPLYGKKVHALFVRMLEKESL